MFKLRYLFGLLILATDSAWLVLPAVSVTTMRARLGREQALGWIDANDAINEVLKAQKSYDEKDKTSALDGGSVQASNFRWFAAGTHFHYGKDLTRSNNSAPHEIFQAGDLLALNPETISTKDLGNGGWQLSIGAKQSAVHVLDTAEIISANNGVALGLGGLSSELVIPDFQDREDAEKVGKLIARLIALAKSGEALSSQPSLDVAEKYFSETISNLHILEQTGNGWSSTGGASASFTQNNFSCQVNYQFASVDDAGNRTWDKSADSTWTVALKDLDEDCLTTVLGGDCYVYLSTRIPNKGKVRPAIVKHRYNHYGATQEEGGRSDDKLASFGLRFKEPESAMAAAKALSLIIQLSRTKN